MGVIYSILEALIPFEFIDYAFMKNALIAIILVTPVFAILGTMIVNNKMAFFSDALGHSALTGIALGMILGISNMNISMILFAVIFALLLNYVKINKLWSRYNNKCIFINSNSTRTCNVSTKWKLQ